MHKLLLLIFTSFLLICACVEQAPPSSALTSVQKPLTWSEKKAKATYCAGDTVHCANYECNYLFFEGDTLLAVKLNKEINQFGSSLLSMEENAPLLGPDSLGNQLVRDYKAYTSEEGAYKVPWEVEIKATVPYQSSALITLDQQAYTYLGGAHPNSFRTITSYALAGGKELSHTDLLTDTIGVAKLLEVKYKTLKEATPESDLKELTFDGSPLPLPKNMAVVKNGILFYYNDYEVAPHAVGPAEILLTWQELGSMATKR
jgi:Deacetylase PdaC/Protein of unknown function (DUF3298)